MRHTKCSFPRNAILVALLYSDFISSATRGVNLIVALGFCKAHYESYPYFIHFNMLMVSPLTEIPFKS